MAFKTVDDFLHHKGSEGGSSSRLKDWTQDPGFLNWWFHVMTLPTAAWFHGIPELVVRDDKNDPTKKLRNVWSHSHACWEDEQILKKMRFRKPDGSYERRPKDCGLCRLGEAVRMGIVAGAIKDTDVLFEFRGSDKPEEDRIIRAGAFCSIWKREPSKEEYDRLSAAGISLKTAWKENGLSKLKYIFVGVNADDVPGGLKVAVQTQGLGNAVQRCIHDEIARKDGAKGNPFEYPYCIRFLYRPNEVKFDDKYHAIATEKAITPEIDRLIRGDAPSIAPYVRKFNQDTVRAVLETRATSVGKRLPWDKIFDVPKKVPDDEPEAAPKGRAQAQVPADVAPPRAAASDPNARPAEGDALGDPCEPPCGAPMKAGATECWKCHAVYKDDAAAAPAQPPPAASAPSEGAIYDDEIPF